MLHCVSTELRAAGLIVLLGLLDELRQLLAAMLVFYGSGLGAERIDVGRAIGVRRHA